MSETTKIILLFSIYASMTFGAIVFKLSSRIKDKNHKKS